MAKKKRRKKKRIVQPRHASSSPLPPWTLENPFESSLRRGKEFELSEERRRSKRNRYIYQTHLYRQTCTETRETRMIVLYVQLRTDPDVVVCFAIICFYIERHVHTDRQSKRETPSCRVLSVEPTPLAFSGFLSREHGTGLAS